MADELTQSADNSPTQTSAPAETQCRHLLNLEVSPAIHSHPARPLTLPIKPKPARSLSRFAYRDMVSDLKTRYKIRVRKWQTRMAGAAYELTYADGRIKRLIAAPHPRGPVSAAIFLHEVGHHAIGFRRYSQRCLEEYYVWQWAFREMSARGIPVDPRVMRHYRRSMYHYIQRERARGVHHFPPELHTFAHWPG